MLSQFCLRFQNEERSLPSKRPPSTVNRLRHHIAIRLDLIHYLRAITYFSSEGFVGFAKRLPTNRRQPYLRNRGLDQVKPGSVIKAYDCENLKNPDTAPEPSSAPACVQEAPWPKVFGGGMFPRLTREAP